MADECSHQVRKPAPGSCDHRTGIVIRRTLILIVGLATAAPVAAGSSVDFTLGLRAEYIGEEQVIEGITSEQTTLRAAIFLAFNGYLADP